MKDIIRFASVLVLAVMLMIGLGFLAHRPTLTTTTTTTDTAATTTVVTTASAATTVPVVTTATPTTVANTAPAATMAPTATPLPVLPPATLADGRLRIGLAPNDFPPENNLREFEFEVGKSMAIVSWYINWDQHLSSRKLEIVCKSGRIPQITWQSTNSGANYKTDPYPLAKIAAGEFDELIRSELQSVANVCPDQTVWIRFDHEMNTKPGVIAWYPWQGDPTNYIAAWQHVVRIGKEINPNIKWIWSLANPHDTYNYRTSAYFPGSQYVDMVGLTLNQYWYPGAKKRWDGFEKHFRADYELLVKFQKPIVLSEVATGEGPDADSKANWIKDMIAFGVAHDQIVGIVWYNRLRAREFHQVNFMVDSSPAAANAFKEALWSVVPRDTRR